MRAIVTDPAGPNRVRFADVAEPEPAADAVLVEVGAVSVNFTDAAHAPDRLPPGTVCGLDVAGVVLAPAADGSGPQPGARVAGVGPGAWAERVALRTADLAVVPDGVDLGLAAALPAAGVTALRAVRALGSVLGRRVLVTGASGGVGRFAVQLAALSGAEVVALVGSPHRGAGLPELGAREVVTGLDGVAPVDGALDNVGGAVLADAFTATRSGGLVLSVGQASGEPTTIDFEAERNRSAGRRLEPFVVGGEFGADLGVLLALLGRGLDPQVGRRESWDRVDEAVRALLDRRVNGKVVLDVG